MIQGQKRMRLKQKFLEMLTTVGGSIDTTHPTVSYCIYPCVILFHYSSFLMLNLCFKYRNYFLHIIRIPYYHIIQYLSQSFFVTLSRSVEKFLGIFDRILSLHNFCAPVRFGAFWLFWIVATATVPAKRCEQLQLDISAQGFLRDHGWTPPQ